MSTTPKYRVIVHTTGKGRSKVWVWTQVARNGSAGAVAPRDYDSKSNAVRAGNRQVQALNWGFDAVLPATDPLVDGATVGGAVLVIDENYVRT